jgi:hypothetical protein
VDVFAYARSFSSVYDEYVCNIDREVNSELDSKRKGKERFALRGIKRCATAKDADNSDPPTMSAASPMQYVRLAFT